jgi:hypothetical protein
MEEKQVNLAGAFDLGQHITDMKEQEKQEKMQKIQQFMYTVETASKLFMQTVDVKEAGVNYGEHFERCFNATEAMFDKVPELQKRKGLA